MSDQSQAMLDLKAIHHSLIHGGASDATFEAHARLLAAVTDLSAPQKPPQPAVSQDAPVVTDDQVLLALNTYHELERYYLSTYSPLARDRMRSALSAALGVKP